MQSTAESLEKQSASRNTGLHKDVSGYVVARVFFSCRNFRRLIERSRDEINIILEYNRQLLL